MNFCEVEIFALGDDCLSKDDVLTLCVQFHLKFGIIPIANAFLRLPETLQVSDTL